MLSLCRLCASLRKMDLLIVIKDDSNEICDKLRKCCQINIKMKDPLPKSICQECMELLNNSHKFYIKVKEAQETLQTLYPSADVDEENEKEFETNSLVETMTTVQKNVKKRKISIIAQTKVVIPNVNNEIVRKKQIKLKKSKDSKKLSSEKTLESYIDQIYEELEMTKEGVEAVDEDSYEQLETIQESPIEDLTLDSDVEEQVFNDEMGNGKEELVNEEDVRDNNEKPIDRVLIESSEYNKDVIVNVKNFNDELEYVSINEQLETTQESQIEDLTLDSDVEEQVFNGEMGNGQDELVNEEDLRDNNEDPINGLLMESNEYNEDVVVNDNNDELEYVNIYEELEEDEDAMEMAEIDSGIKQNEFRLKSWRNYNYICFICDFQGTDFIKLKNHIIQNHNITEIDNFKYKCCDCQKTISRYNLFLNHVRSKHHPGLKLKCEVCDLNCQNFEELSLHRSVNCVEAYNYGSIASCNQCYKSFHNIDDLQNHQKFIHGNDKVKLLLHEETNPFNCSFCGSTFSRKSSLEQHMFIHVDDKLYKCKICNKSFKSFFDLDKHQIIHSDVILFKCDFCVKLFLTKIEKITHERTHTGEMPFVCDICDKRFSMRRALKAHVKRHTAVKKYSCEYCDKTFADGSNRNKHVKRKHANEVEK